MVIIDIYLPHLLFAITASLTNPPMARRGAGRSRDLFELWKARAGSRPLRKSCGTRLSNGVYRKRLRASVNSYSFMPTLRTSWIPWWSEGFYDALMHTHPCMCVLIYNLSHSYFYHRLLNLQFLSFVLFQVLKPIWLQLLLSLEPFCRQTYLALADSGNDHAILKVPVHAFQGLSL